MDVEECPPAVGAGAAVDSNVVAGGAVGLAAGVVGAGATGGYVEAISGGDLVFFIPWLLWGAFLF